MLAFLSLLLVSNLYFEPQSGVNASSNGRCAAPKYTATIATGRKSWSPQPQKENFQMKRILNLALFFCLSTLPVMAADVTGTWTYEVRGGVTVWGKQDPGSYHPLLKVLISLKAEGSVLTGTVTFPPSGSARTTVRQISNGTIDGDNLTFDTVS